MDLETWLWKTKKIRIRGGEPSKLRLSTPYFLLHKDVDRFLAAFDEYRSSASRRVISGRRTIRAVAAILGLRRKRGC